MVNTLVTWSVNGTVVDTARNFTSIEHNKLIFSRVTTFDSGEYTCSLVVTSTQSFISVDDPKLSAVKVISVQSNVTITILFSFYNRSFFTVPSPTVTIAKHPNGKLYPGINLTLTCTVMLSTDVNNNEIVTIKWSSDQAIPRERYSLTDTEKGPGNIYSRNFTVGPLAEHDNGTFTCTGTISRGTISEHSVNISITPEGWHHSLKIN